MREKRTPIDGWTGWMDNEEEIRAKTEASCLCLLSSSCTRRKWNRQKQISGVYPSHCFMIHLWVETSAAEGNHSGSSECVCQGSNGNQFRDQISGGRRWFQRVCKNTHQTTSGTLTLFFRTLSVGSDFKSSNIVSSLILPILHSLFSVSLFLIYIYIFFSGFFFLLYKMRDRMMDSWQYI